LLLIAPAGWDDADEARAAIAGASQLPFRVGATEDENFFFAPFAGTLVSEASSGNWSIEGEDWVLMGHIGGADLAEASTVSRGEPVLFNGSEHSVIVIVAGPTDIDKNARSLVEGLRFPADGTLVAPVGGWSGVFPLMPTPGGDRAVGGDELTLSGPWYAFSVYPLSPAEDVDGAFVAAGDFIGQGRGDVKLRAIGAQVWNTAPIYWLFLTDR